MKPERSFSGKPGERRGPRREGGGFGGGGERRGAGGPPRGGSKFGDRKRGFGGRRDDRREHGTPRAARAAAGNRRHFFARRKRRRVARAPDQDDRPRLSAVRHCAAHFAEAGALCRQAGREENSGAGVLAGAIRSNSRAGCPCRFDGRAAAVCLRARRNAVVERGRSRRTRPEKSFRHVLPGRAHGRRSRRRAVTPSSRNAA